jgi:hypothetical protein
MGEMELASGEEREKAELAHKNALEGLRADYRITAETRREAEVHIPSYEVWLEGQVLLYRSLVGYERAEKEALEATLGRVQEGLKSLKEVLNPTEKANDPE